MVLIFCVLFMYALGLVAIMRLSNKISFESIVSGVLWPLIFVALCSAMIIGSWTMKDIEDITETLKNVENNTKEE